MCVRLICLIIQRQKLFLFFGFLSNYLVHNWVQTMLQNINQLLFARILQSRRGKRSASMCNKTGVRDAPFIHVFIPEHFSGAEQHFHSPCSPGAPSCGAGRGGCPEDCRGPRWQKGSLSLPLSLWMTRKARRKENKMMSNYERDWVLISPAKSERLWLWKCLFSVGR